MQGDEFEKIAERFCDYYCKYPYICKTQEELDTMCNHCPVEDLKKVSEE